jgi:hypothetical protein
MHLFHFSVVVAFDMRYFASSQNENFSSDDTGVIPRMDAIRITAIRITFISDMGVES